MGYFLNLYALPWPELESRWRARHSQSPKMPVRVPEAIAVEFLETIGESGLLLATLDHASASADEFLDQFMGKVIGQAFSEETLQDLIMNRPLCGNQSGDLPCWGGLRLAEVKRLLSQFEAPRDLSEDEESWLRNLKSALEEAERRGEDLVSVYT